MLHCITNDVDGLRSCTAQGLHVETCERDTCTGCLPRSAKVGILCFGCWFDLEHALADYGTARRLLSELRHHRAVTPDPGSGHAGPRLPLTLLDVDLDALDRLHAKITYPLEACVATPDGAEAAVRFARMAAYALPRHPVREQPHNLPRTRCPNCSLLTLREHPPAHAGDARTVSCSNCGHTLEQSAYEALAAIEAQCCRRCRATTCTDPGCRCHQVAAVPEWQRTNKGEHVEYDPKANPADVDLFDRVILDAALRAKSVHVDDVTARLPSVPEVVDGRHVRIPVYSRERVAAALERLGDHPDLEPFRKRATA